MTVRVVTDSAASVPPQIASELGIEVVPLHLVVDGRDVADGDVALEVAAREAGITTSAPSPGEFVAALERCSEEVVIMTIASKMSATYKAARLASQSVDGAVRVVDTGTAAGAEGLAVIAAAKAAATGAPIDEVEARACDVSRRVRLVAAVDGLDSLVRSGRVPGLAGWAGSALGLQPLFAFHNGKVKRLRPSNSRQHALTRIVHEFHRSRPDGPARLHAAVLHALAERDAMALYEQVAADVEPDSCFVGEFSAVMVAHTGPGLVGLAWWWEPVDLAS